MTVSRKLLTITAIATVIARLTASAATETDMRRAYSTRLFVASHGATKNTRLEIA